MHTHRILVTRSPHQASELAEALRALGADPILIPTIELTTPTTFAPLDAVIAHLETFDWLLFTSANAVQVFQRRCNSLPPSLKIAVIGPATAQALQKSGISPNLIPPQAIAESLATALLPNALRPDGTPTKFLLIRAESAREHLPETLRAAGAEVTVAPAYRTVTPPGSVDALRQLFTTKPPDAITFTSSSTVENLFSLLKAANLTLPPQIIRASIGPITTQTITTLGYPPQIEAETATVHSLASTLVAYLQSAGTTPHS